MVRYMDEDENTYRAVLQYKDPRTGALVTNYIGPYSTPSALKGQLTLLIKENKSEVKNRKENNEWARKRNASLPDDAPKWQYQTILDEALELVAVKRQVASAWTDYDSFKEV